MKVTGEGKYRTVCEHIFHSTLQTSAPVQIKASNHCSRLYALLLTPIVPIFLLGHLLQDLVQIFTESLTAHAEL